MICVATKQNKMPGKNYKKLLLSDKFMLPVISTDYYKVKDVILLAKNNMYNGEKTNITVVC